MEVRKRGVYASVADIPRDEDGFPVAGLVVRHYRNKKGWTQEQLARKLGTKDLMVRMMETKNQGLDSIERRRLLCKILGIPPIVLGLGSLEQLERVLQLESTPLKTTPTVLQQSSTPTIDTYNKLLVEYNNTNIVQSGASLIDAVEMSIPTLYSQIRDTSYKKEKHELLYLAWEFHNIAHKLEADYKRNISLSIRHLGHMLTIAHELHNPNLLAITHQRLAYLRLLEGPQQARVEIDAALAHLKNATPVVQSDVYGLAARIYLLSKVDGGDISTSKYFFDRSKKTQPKNIGPTDSPTPMGLTVVRCQLTQIDTLIAGKHANDALDIIEQIESNTPSGYQRREAHLSIDRAQCFLLLDYPEYAIQLLEHGYTISKDIGDRDKIRQIRNIYRQLKAGPYKNNRAVLDFEERLLKL
jgi:transcriptional regulator with XRE-family HTH domain